MDKWLKSSTPAKSAVVCEPTPLPSPLAANNALSSTQNDTVARFECDLSVVASEKPCVEPSQQTLSQELCFLSISSSMADAIDIAFNTVAGSDPDIAADVERTATYL